MLHLRWPMLAMVLGSPQGAWARVGPPPELVGRLWAWPCASAALLLQPSVVMDLPFGLVRASSSWPLAATACPRSAHHSVAVGFLAMPCRCRTRLGVKCHFTDYKGGISALVLQPDLPTGGRPVPAWHCWRSCHLIWCERPLPAPQLESSVSPNCWDTLWSWFSLGSPSCSFKSGHHTCSLGYLPIWWACQGTLFTWVL